MDNTKRFDGRSELYAKGRPQYAAGLFEYLKNTLGTEAGSVFADVGSGTGIFTAQLLERGYDRQGYIDRALSSSYSLRENDDGYAAYLKELHGIFDRFSVNGLLTVPTDTVAYIGTV